MTDEINRQLVSPQIHPDRRVTFRIKAPRATQVLVKGIGSLPPQSLDRDDAGIWQTTVGPLPPERYSYVFEVDGADHLDLHNRDVKKWLSLQDQFEIPGDPPLLHERTPVAHGVLSRHVYDGALASAERTAWVYTPPGYDPHCPQPYPLLYLFHGYGDDESAWHEVGCCPWIADNLIAQQRIEPLIVVMPYGHPLRLDLSREFDDYARDNLVAMENDLLHHLDPYIKRHFRVEENAGRRAIAGLSMGGGQSLTIGLRHYRQFAHIGGFSSAAPQQPLDQAFPTLVADVPRANAEIKTLWIACGEEDFLLHRNDEFAERLKQAGVDYVYDVTQGGHDWMVWRKYLPDFLERAFPRDSV